MTHSRYSPRLRPVHRSSGRGRGSNSAVAPSITAPPPYPPIITPRLVLLLQACCSRPLLLQPPPAPAPQAAYAR